VALIEIHVHSDAEKLDRLLKMVKHLGGQMKITQEDINQLNDKARKILTEVGTARDQLRNQIAELERQIAEGNDVDLAPLQETLSLLDDLTPDAPVEEPTPGEGTEG
jgi:hypothetical protein